ncbi:hypothetical protein B0H17DRAFT_507500 [Mycena rosella]|uniref:Uncharacterized protein n=1 Tax=Mycena rosella TaxID=1033263 RepID=A0AAD7BYA3_MYCRO|nr:hypothetical protein B0H17DRAFT_507500 [Mycena rosella]
MHEHEDTTRARLGRTEDPHRPTHHQYRSHGPAPLPVRSRSRVIESRAGLDHVAALKTRRRKPQPPTVHNALVSHAARAPSEPPCHTSYSARLGQEKAPPSRTPAPHHRRSHAHTPRQRAIAGNRAHLDCAAGHRAPGMHPRMPTLGAIAQSRASTISRQRRFPGSSRRRSYTICAPVRKCTHRRA